MRSTAKLLQHPADREVASALFIVAFCVVGISGCRLQQPVLEPDKPLTHALDCYRGITSPPDTQKGLENVKRVHGGFSHWGSYSEKIREAGIISFPIAASGWSIPESKKPEWSFRKNDGSPKGNFVCWNSPFKDYVVDQMEELVRNQPVDGFMLDALWWGTMGTDRTDWCCCLFCERAYKEKFGTEMPKLIDWDSMDPSLIKRCIEWRRDSLEEVSTRIRDRVKAIRPDIVLNFHGGPSWHLDAGNLFSRISCQRLSDLAYFENYRNEVFWAAFLRGMARGPTALHTPYLQDAFHAHDPIGGYSNDSWNASISGLVAHGCRPVTYLRWEPDGGLRKSYIDLIEPLYREVKEKEPYLRGHTPILYAAIVYSETSQTYYRRNIRERSALPHLEGVFETIQRLRVPVEFIEAGMDLNLETLKKFQVVVLPNVAILTPPQSEALTEYVKQGGAILATYETGLYDELGERTSNFALSEVLGVDYERHREDKWVQETAQGVGTYLAPRRDFLAHLQELLAPGQNTTLHMAGPAVISRRTSGESRATLALIGPSSSGGPIHTRANQTDIPAVHVNHFGKGRAAYISNPLYKLIKIPHITDHDTFPTKQHRQWPFARAEGWILDLTRELLDELAPGPPIRVEGPHHLESTFFEQDEEDRVVVHLINSTVRLLGKTYVIGPATILVRKDLARGRKAALVWPERRDLTAKEKGEYLEVEVPETGVHQIVIFEPLSPR